MWISGRGCLTLMCGLFVVSIVVGAAQSIPPGFWPFLGWLIVVAFVAAIIWALTKVFLDLFHWHANRSNRQPPTEIGLEDTPEWKK